MNFFLMFSLMFFSALAAAENPRVSFEAKCKTSPPFALTNVEIQSDFVWQGYGTDLGPTTIKLTKESQSKTLELSEKDQTFFRETELGIIFFGTYKNANLTAPNQTVHVILAYQSVISILQELSLSISRADKIKPPQQREFLLSIFAEEDRASNLFLPIKCDFEVIK